MSDPYLDFLKAKVAQAPSTGFETIETHPILKPHQRDIVQWAVQGGRRAIFASFGLGKTLMQLEFQRLILQRNPGRGLIVCPLGVRQEFIRDARLIGVSPKFVRTHAEVGDDGIYITNYESVREGKINPSGFIVVSLDEAAIMRGFGGSKTFRTFMGHFEGTSVFRSVATATPSPNEYLELLAYSAFLGVGDVGEMKTRFFKRDSTKADNLTLHPHKVKEFWLWVSTWAVASVSAPANARSVSRIPSSAPRAIDSRSA